MESKNYSTIANPLFLVLVLIIASVTGVSTTFENASAQLKTYKDDDYFFY